MSEVAQEILTVSIEDEMQQSYLDYAMSVIVGRALPDVRDGLKPVHRRVLHAMRELGNDYNKAYKKSARVVGDVIGKYHPHGDSAVYDTIVRMAQPFSMRYMLVDGQGNFGSVDGDAPAAMRYTEVRMSRIAHEILADIDRDTVDFVENYDGSESEPAVMPTRVPNLLVNGSSGIAVGMATNIPPHNLNEIVNACLALIDMLANELCSSIVKTTNPHNKCRHRLIESLVDLAKHFGKSSPQGLIIDCPVSRRELSSMTGMSTENLIRILKKLKEEGLLVDTRNTIIIPDLEKLREIVSPATLLKGRRRNGAAA